MVERNVILRETLYQRETCSEGEPVLRQHICRGTIFWEKPVLRRMQFYRGSCPRESFSEMKEVLSRTLFWRTLFWVEPLTFWGEEILFWNEWCFEGSTYRKAAISATPFWGNVSLRERLLWGERHSEGNCSVGNLVQGHTILKEMVFWGEFSSEGNLVENTVIRGGGLFLGIVSILGNAVLKAILGTADLFSPTAFRLGLESQEKVDIPLTDACFWVGCPQFVDNHLSYA